MGEEGKWKVDGATSEVATRASTLHRLDLRFDILIWYRRRDKAKPRSVEKAASGDSDSGDRMRR